MSSVRAFLAVPAGDDTRDAFARAGNNLRTRLGLDRSRRARVTWVRSEAVHLTLKFLGDIDDALATPLGEAIGLAVRACQPLELPLTRVGVYPHADHPRVLWIGPPDAWAQTDAARQMAALHAAVEDACAGVGLSRDPKPWSPHVTLGRIRSGERDVASALRSRGILERTLTIPPLIVSAVVLMKSELLPEGPRHTPLWEHRLNN